MGWRERDEAREYFGIYFAKQFFMKTLRSSPVFPWASLLQLTILFCCDVFPVFSLALFELLSAHFFMKAALAAPDSGLLVLLIAFAAQSFAVVVDCAIAI